MPDQFIIIELILYLLWHHWDFPIVWQRKGFSSSGKSPCVQTHAASQTKLTFNQS